jgi:hypothetical protein
MRTVGLALSALAAADADFTLALPGPRAVRIRY